MPRRSLKRGAIPSPRSALAAATPFAPGFFEAPPHFLTRPALISTWGNVGYPGHRGYGDCVTAEEAFALATNTPEIFITEDEVISWAEDHGFLDGAMIIDVLKWMHDDGFKGVGVTFDAGRSVAVAYTNSTLLQSAIYRGPVKIGVAADQLEAACNTTEMVWFATGFHADNAYDHCVSLCGYGTINWLAQRLGVQVPERIDGTEIGYALFTWGLIGIINEASLLAITGEAWLREPTTVTRVRWSDWQWLSLQGNKAKFLALAAHPDGRMHALMAGLDDQVWHNEQLSAALGAGWSDWQWLSHPGNKAKFLALAAHPDGRMHALMAGLDDQVWHNEQLSAALGAGWSDWQWLSHPGNKAKFLALAAHPDGRMHALMAGLDDQVWHNEQLSAALGAGWSDWQPLSQSGNKAKFLALAAHPDGRMHALMAGLDDQVWHNEQLSAALGAGWSDWQWLSHPGNKAKFLALAAHPDGRMHALMAGLDDQVWHNEQLSAALGAGWSDWQPLSQSGNKAKFLALAAHPDGRMHALMAGLDDQVWQSEQLSAAVQAEWSGWRVLTRPVNKATFLALAAHSDGRMHALMAGLDNQVWHDEQLSASPPR